LINETSARSLFLQIQEYYRLLHSVDDFEVAPIIEMNIFKNKVVIYQKFVAGSTLEYLLRKHKNDINFVSFLLKKIIIKIFTSIPSRKVDQNSFSLQELLLFPYDWKPSNIIFYRNDIERMVLIDFVPPLNFYRDFIDVRIRKFFLNNTQDNAREDFITYKTATYLGILHNMCYTSLWCLDLIDKKTSFPILDEKIRILYNTISMEIGNFIKVKAILPLILVPIHLLNDFLVRTKSRMLTYNELNMVMTFYSYLLKQFRLF